MNAPEATQQRHDQTPYAQQIRRLAMFTPIQFPGLIRGSSRLAAARLPVRPRQIDAGQCLLVRVTTMQAR